MFVLDAAMVWVFGAAAGGAALIGLLALGAVRRRRKRAAQAARAELTVAATPRALPTQPPPLPATVPAAEPVRPAETRSPDEVRAEISAHAERLAAARAARASRQAAEAEAAQAALAAQAVPSTQAAKTAAAVPAPSSAAGPAIDLPLDDLAPRPPELFDPTRGTRVQQVVVAVAEARAGARVPAPTEALRQALATARSEPEPVGMRTASVRPGDFMVRTAVPRVPPLDAAERDARPRRVLVADDARVVRVKLQRLLAAQGWQVIEAADGEEAWRRLQEDRPDLLITDVDMPAMDGFALTRAVRAHPASARLPVVMITAADDQHRDEAQRAGVTVLLGKPYGEAALLAHLRRLMGLQPLPELAAG